MNVDNMNLVTAPGGSDPQVPAVVDGASVYTGSHVAGPLRSLSYYREGTEGYSLASATPNASSAVSWETGNKDRKFEITESKIIDLHSQIKWVKDIMVNDKYWGLDSLSERDRGKIIKELNKVSFSLINLDTCPKVKPPKNPESVKNTIKKAITDLDSIANDGLADRNRSIYDKTLAVKLSLEIAQADLCEDSHDKLGEDEQMRILRSPANSPTGPQLNIIRQDSQSSIASVISVTSLFQGNLDTAGPSDTQRRQQPESETSPGFDSVPPKKSKNDTGPDENINDLNHLAHAEIDHLRTIIESDALAKRITVAIRKDLNGSYNRICSVVRDITYQHARLEGAHSELLKKIETQAVAPIMQHVNIDNEGSYANALRSRKEPVAEPVRTGKHGARSGNKPAPVPAPSTVQESEQNEGTFQVVGRKNKTMSKTTQPGNPTSSRRKALKKCRLAKTGTRLNFTIPTGTTAAQAKTDLWQTVKGKIANPRAKTFVRGDQITIIPDDDKTLEVLRQLPRVQILGPRSPRVIIYDVDAELTVDDITQGLVTQNPELGLTTEDMDMICAKHRLGPRTGSTVHWVIEVSAMVLPKLENKSVFLGLTKCKVKLHQSLPQCYNCQAYGHTSLKCTELPRCRHCAKAHNSRDCTEKDKSVCTNCRGDHKASSYSCSFRDKAIKSLLRRTDFGQK